MGRDILCERSFGDLHQLRGSLVDVLEIIQQMKGIFELPEIVILPQGADASAFRLCFLDSSGSRQRQRRDGMGVNMSVRQLSSTNGKISSLLDLAEPQQCERPRPMHRKQHRIKRAEMICGVSCLYHARGIAGLTVYECESVVSHRIAWT
jgi:hypothetical protein